MPNSDGTNNVWDALKAIGIAAIFAALIVLSGSSIKYGWSVMIVTPLCTGIGGWLVSRKSVKKVSFPTIATWTAVGLVIGVLWYIFS